MMRMNEEYEAFDNATWKQEITDANVIFKSFCTYF